MSENKLEKQYSSTPLKFQVNFLSASLTGCISSIVFHPWDVALFRSIEHKRTFFHAENFTFNGISQTFFQRSFSTGLYFFMQQTIKSALDNKMPHDLKHRDQINSFSTGLLAGSFCGAVTNPLSAIKYYSWKSENKNSFLKNTRDMWLAGGYKIFARGLPVTLLRDSIYGCIYELTRGILKNLTAYFPFHSAALIVVNNLLAATFATLIVSPLTYARVKQYSAPIGKEQKHLKTILDALYQQAKLKPTKLEQARFFSQTFRLGNSLSRSAVGMAFAQMCSDNVHSFLSKN